MHRIMIYNIAYASGAPCNYLEHIFKVHRYLNRSNKNMLQISRLIKKTDADVIGLIEIDTGSIGTALINQADEIGKRTQHYSHYTTKYGDTLSGKMIPILRKQGNAILTKNEDSNGIYHYFPGGFKKLIIELEMEEYDFFLVHLALSKRVRKVQLRHMANLLSSRKKPVVIAGDFNVFKGENELKEIQESLGLINPNIKNIPTFPSWKPKYELDFMLCSKEIKVKNFEIPNVKLSDHLPVVMEFEV
jgi:endonuclease/exonuclease/phosphatase family metal-dependent hydrolase